MTKSTKTGLPPKDGTVPAPGPAKKQSATAYLLARLRDWERPLNSADPTGLVQDVGTDKEGHHYVEVREGHILDTSGRSNGDKAVDRHYREKEHVQHLVENIHEARPAGNPLEVAKAVSACIDGALATASSSAAGDTLQAAQQAIQAAEDAANMMAAVITNNPAANAAARIAAKVLESAAQVGGPGNNSIPIPRSPDEKTDDALERVFFAKDVLDAIGETIGDIVGRIFGG